MASIKTSSFFVPPPTEYAKAGLRWLGHEPRCTPYWPHSIIWGLLYSLPEFCSRFMAPGLLSQDQEKRTTQRFEEKSFTAEVWSTSSSADVVRGLQTFYL
ncbi:putative very-long-chain 3-oxoacyl-CoA reductase [Helianthus anomalus]